MKGIIIAKIVAIAAIVGLIVFLVAPIKYGDGETTLSYEATTIEPSEAITVPITEDPIANQDTQTGESTDNGHPSTETPQPTQASTQSNEQANSVPTDTAGIVDYFNTALAKSSLKRTEYTRKLTRCDITIIGDKTSDSKVQELVGASASTAALSNPVSLSVSNVTNASSSVSGNTISLAIELNAHKSTASIANGDAGYIGLVEYDEIAALVNKIANEALGVNATLKSVSEYNISNGKYTVIIDQSSGKITSLKYTCNEGGSGKASAFIPVTVNLGIDISAVYAE